MKNTRSFLLLLFAAPLFPASRAQASFTSPADDPFIATIESMKHSIAPLVCLSLNGDVSTVLSRVGSVFFFTPSGDFLTAAHNLSEMQGIGHPCPVAAITLPTEGWQPRALNEPAAWFPFKIDDCAIDKVLDVAICRPLSDLSRLRPEARIVPVRFDWTLPPDGMQAAFTGFPLGVRDPMTFRADIAAYLPIWSDEKVIDELMLDRKAWPGFSGSPAFRADGRVVGIVVKGVLDEGAAMTFLRPMSAVKAMVDERLKK